MSKRNRDGTDATATDNDQADPQLGDNRIGATTALPLFVSMYSQDCANYAVKNMGSTSTAMTKLVTELQALETDLATVEAAIESFAGISKALDMQEVESKKSLRALQTELQEAAKTGNESLAEKLVSSLIKAQDALDKVVNDKTTMVQTHSAQVAALQDTVKTLIMNYHELSSKSGMNIAAAEEATANVRGRLKSMAAKLHIKNKRPASQLASSETPTNDITASNDVDDDGHVIKYRMLDQPTIDQPTNDQFGGFAYSPHATRTSSCRRTTHTPHRPSACHAARGSASRKRSRR